MDTLLDAVEQFLGLNGTGRGTVAEIAAGTALTQDDVSSVITTDQERPVEQQRFVVLGAGAVTLKTMVALKTSGTTYSD